MSLSCKGLEDIPGTPVLSIPFRCPLFTYSVDIIDEVVGVVNGCITGLGGGCN